MKEKLTLLIILIFAGVSLSNAQSITRSVLCGIGATYSNSSATMTTTFAQCPGCTTLEAPNGSAILTQGFQQPVSNAGCFVAAFDFDLNSDNCGVTFDFFYTGNADINAVTFEWDFGEGAFPETSEMINPIGIAFSSIGSKTVTLRVYDNDGCDISVASMLNVQAIGFSTNPIITDISCKGSNNGSVELEVSGGSGPYTYLWSNGETTPSQENLAPGDYSYTVTDGTGCTSANAISVFEPLDSIMIEFEVLSETCAGDLDGAAASNITGGTPPYNITWSTGSTANNLNGVGSGEYELTVIDFNECELTSTVFIGEKCDPRVYNTISPNGDGINDVWVIPDIEGFPNNEVRIYNRWGELVYREDGYVNTWAGTNTSGQPLVAGAYYFVVKLNDPSNNILTGAVTIVR